MSQGQREVLGGGPRQFDLSLKHDLGLLDPGPATDVEGDGIEPDAGQQPQGELVTKRQAILEIPAMGQVAGSEVSWVSASVPWANPGGCWPPAHPRNRRSGPAIDRPSSRSTSLLVVTSGVSSVKPVSAVTMGMMAST